MNGSATGRDEVFHPATDSGQVVAVTAEAQDVATIKQLAQQQRSGASADQLKTEVEKIVRNATTLR